MTKTAISISSMISVVIKLKKNTENLAVMMDLVTLTLFIYEPTGKQANTIR